MEEPEWQPPNAHHRFCLRHLLSNFNRQMGSVKLKKMYGRTAEQRQPHKVIEGLKAIGVATVTLLDVAILTRLPIEGHAVCTVGCQLESWQDKVHRILGVRPPAEVTKGSALRVTWIAQHFSHLPDGADEPTVERYAKAYLLYLIGAVLFSDKTGNRVQLLYLTLLDAPWEVVSSYSWGSVALAYLYRRLCEASRKNVKEITGPLIILQGIPPPCDTLADLHHSSRKGREPKNWLEINWRHVARWDQRLELLA
ncbi:protein MAIN-LIKE 2-like [Amaranthus tricolor]|uniref:protein MAIN-LIKE 2-like n=1 Tax=Amaranthus tricolor TaxID=29722 RepID=UPI00258CD64E|nr:protein MAIN-LIKE 2-like [Amaranthus tricolor]